MGTFGNTFSLIQGVGQRLLNLIPLKPDALVWLDGTILNSSGTYYFVDKSGNHRNFLITGYDFNTDWTKGMPYKTAATISAPAGDATLIAADLNNYFYTGGTPNQIPVVSLFQDIDYEHKFFCRHKAQVVDSNGVETYEPRVIEVVVYNTVKTGNDLTLCQSYFTVPVEATSNVIWISKLGNNNNAGTKASPYLTLAKTNVAGSVGKTIYIKTGAYIEDNELGYFRIDYGITFTGIGNINVSATSTTRLIYAVNGNIEFRNMTIDGKDATGIGVSLYLNNTKTTTFNKVRIINCKTDFISGAANVNDARLINCIIPGKIIAVYATQKLSALITLIDTCYFKNLRIDLLVNDCILKNSKLGESDQGWFIYGIGPGLTAYGNSLSYQGLAISLYTPYTTSKIMKIHHNKFIQNILSNIQNVGIYLNGTIDLEIYNNNFTSDVISDNVHGQGFVFAFCTNVNIHDNIFNSASSGGFCHISAQGVGTIIQNNFSHSESLSGYQFVLTGESYLTGLNDNSIIENNTLIGSKLNHPNDNTSTHSLMINSGINIRTRYNKISYTCIGIVIKTGQTLAYTSEGVYYNLLQDCYKSIVVEGVGGLNVFSNTILISDATYNQGNVYPIMVLAQPDEAGDHHCENILLKNNIISVRNNLARAIYFDQWAADHGCIVQNSVINGGAGLLTIVSTNWDNLATAQAAGKLLGCVISDPLLDANLIPTTPIIIGENEGSDYEDGLDISTNWGNNETLPVIVTKKQPTEGLWQVGAYIK